MSSRTLRSLVLRRRVGGLAAIAAAPLLGACDPCWGMGRCFADPHVTVVGRLLDETTGAPVPRARIDLIRTGGIALASDSVRALADGNGNFVLSVPAPTDGRVAAEIVIRHPSNAAATFEYRVHDLSFDTFRQVGDAHVLPPWSTIPSLPDIAQLQHTGVAQASLRGVNVTFRRTGGIALAGADSFHVVTGDNGVFPLFDRQLQPLGAGDVIGDLYVEYGGFVYRDFPVRAKADFKPEVGLRVIDITPAAGARPQ